ncbi:hypothetical protein NDU88_004604 [Pleurodeles waltl]|uniref:Uncharacterized protein n=1 Tax=Pleurodeles waltl TaxID=8319 RepID=A0AAV7UGY1_PLEWA|nr:hypothetical protein NDU88_004604 [Pleurodeles waltl]
MGPAAIFPLLLLMCWSAAEGGRLLVVPLDASHWFAMRDVVEELGHRGHQVVVLVPEYTLLVRQSQHYTLRSYPVPYNKEQLNQRMDYLKNYFVDGSRVEKILAGTFEYQIVLYLTGLFFEGCANLLTNESMIQALQEDHFDALVTDPALPCGVILAEQFKLPFVHTFRGYPCGLEHVATNSPSPTAYVPRCYTLSSDQMVFRERIWNFIFSYLERLLFKNFYSQYESLAAKVLQRDVNLMELYGRASVWLLRYDFVFEYPRPMMPNMVLIGGLNCKERRELKEVHNNK